MKTIAQTITEKTDRILDLFIQYDEMERKTNESYDRRDFDEFAIMRQQRETTLRQIKRSVRNLAKMLGFEIKELEFPNDTEEWRDVYNAIIRRYHHAQSILHTLNYSDRKYLENNENIYLD